MFTLVSIHKEKLANLCAHIFSSLKARPSINNSITRTRTRFAVQNAKTSDWPRKRRAHGLANPT